MNPETLVFHLLLPLQSIAALLAAGRVLRGPSAADRVVALELLATIAVAFAATLAMGNGRSVFVDVALLLALISFIGTIAFARLLEGRSRRV